MREFVTCANPCFYLVTQFRTPAISSWSHKSSQARGLLFVGAPVNGMWHATLFLPKKTGMLFPLSSVSALKLSLSLRRGFWAVITCIRPSGPHGVQQNGYEITDVVPKKNKERDSKWQNFITTVDFFRLLLCTREGTCCENISLPLP